MAANQTVSVAIEIARGDKVRGPVAVEVEGLPEGVVVSPLEIAKGQTAGVLEFFAAEPVDAGAITIRMSVGCASIEMKMDLQ